PLHVATLASFRRYETVTGAWRTCRCARWRLGTALHHAAYEGHTEVAQLLLRHGANVDARGEMNRTPLSLASFHGHRDIVQLLLDHGAEVDPESKHYETPLWEASELDISRSLGYCLIMGRTYISGRIKIKQHSR
ncbi:ankyrin repeat-containing domain protein, partial [Russula brevipes]